MDQPVALELAYLSLIEFLMIAKQRLFELGIKRNLSGMQVVAILLIENPSQLSNLRHIFNCDPSNVTGIIDGLEQKQLALRYENPKDRRTKMVKLLPEGQALRISLLQQLISSDELLLAKLTTPELNTFIQLMQKITK